jgi:hypothetical protein
MLFPSIDTRYEHKAVATETPTKDVGRKWRVSGWYIK